MKDYVELSKKHFDGQASEYDSRNTAYYSKYPKISCKDVADRLVNLKYDSLLDIGCGTGYLIELLQNRKKADYYGLDLSPEMLKMAKAKFGNDVTLKEGEADSLPYKDDTFDVVTCIQSFHHYPYPEKAMSEVYRVLKPGGLYILSDTGMGGFMKWIYNHLLLKKVNSGDYAVYSKRDIGDLMTACGFSVIDGYKISRVIYTVIGTKKT